MDTKDDSVNIDLVIKNARSRVSAGKLLDVGIQDKGGIRDHYCHIQPSPGAGHQGVRSPGRQPGGFGRAKS